MLKHTHINDNVIIVPDIHESENSLKTLERILNSEWLLYCVLMWDYFYSFREHRNLKEEIWFLEELINCLEKLLWITDNYRFKRKYNEKREKWHTSPCKACKWNWEDNFEHPEYLDKYIKWLKWVMQPWLFEWLNEWIILFTQAMEERPDLKLKITKIIENTQYIHEDKIFDQDKKEYMRLIFAHSILRKDYETPHPEQRHRNIWVSYDTKPNDLDKMRMDIKESLKPNLGDNLYKERRDWDCVLVYNHTTDISIHISQQDIWKTFYYQKPNLDWTILENWEYKGLDRFTYFYWHNHTPRTFRRYYEQEQVFRPKSLSLADTELNILNHQKLLINPGTWWGVVDRRSFQADDHGIMILDIKTWLIQCLSETTFHRM